MLYKTRQLDRIAGNTIIQFTAVDPARLKVDAVVEEQDTNLLLGKAPVIMETVESFPALVEQMEQQIREKPGSVIVKESKPKRLIAIIYDVEHTPSGEAAGISEALLKIFEQCSKYKISVLAMPLLGTSYGKLTDDHIIQILQDILVKNRQKSPKKIFIYQRTED
jgi:hypothetical protein